jgi:hypothetical protein
LDTGKNTELVAQERVHGVGVETGGQRVEVVGEELDQAGGDGLLDDAQRRLLRLSGRLLRLSGLLPYLPELGERWQRGTASIATEHFASNLIRGRVAGLARGRGSGHGPQALLACPSGELHHLALMIFGIALTVVRGAFGLDRQGAVLNGHLDAVRVDARQVSLDVVAAVLTAVDIHGHSERGTRPGRGHGDEPLERVPVGLVPDH